MNSIDQRRGAGEVTPSLLMQARMLARRGQRHEAMDCLANALAGGECGEAEALDLKARIHAQQGQLLLAETCWRKALTLDGDNTVYADGLEALRRVQRPYVSWWWLVIGGALTVLLLVQLVLAASAQQAEERSREDLTRHLARFEQLAEGMRGDVAGVGATVARTMAPLAKTPEVAESTRRTVAELRQDLERLEREHSARSARDREAVLRRISDSEARLEARLVAIEEQLTGQRAP